MPGALEVGEDATALLEAVARDASITAASRRLGGSLIARIPELAGKSRLLVSPDAELHGIPFDVLIGATGKSLLDTHVVSYVPSASVLVVLRGRADAATSNRVLAVSASPGAPVPLGPSPARPRRVRVFRSKATSSPTAASTTARINSPSRRSECPP